MRAANAVGLVLERARWPFHRFAATTAGVTAVVAVFSTSPHSVVVLALMAALSVGFAYTIFGCGGAIRVGRAFSILTLLAVAIYWAQKITLPEYMGFSGGLGVGTDDSYFYSLAVSNLPADFPVRSYFLLVDHPYAKLLRLVSKTEEYLAIEVHPLDLLVVNVAFLALLAPCVREIIFGVTGDERAADACYWMTLFCPFIAANGLVLIRDGIVTSAFALAIFALLRRQWLLLIMAVGFATWLRIQHGILIAFVVGVIWLVSGPRERIMGLVGKRLLALGAIALLSVVVVAGLWTQLNFAEIAAKLAGVDFARQAFLDTFFAQAMSLDSGTSTYATITQLPWYGRLPLSFLFFFGLPYFQPASVHVDGVLVPRYVLHSVFGVLFCIYIGYFVRGTLRAIRERHRFMISVVAIYLVSIALVAQFSMQPRHKIPLMVLFYIVVAFGALKTNVHEKHVGYAASLAMGFFVLIYNAYIEQVA